MTETMRIYAEVGFNILYLLGIWFIVALMFYRKNRVIADNEAIAKLLRWGFFLLALGDTGHVGFRVWAYGLGSLESVVTIGAAKIPLVGAGALSTAVTVTFLYMFIALVWRKQNPQSSVTQYYAIIAILIIRLVLMIIPANDWGAVVPPFGWSILRNLPLTAAGLWIAFNLFIDGKNDTFQRQMGFWIFLSYGFYIPVILFVQRVPLIGMLMIPKTLAYIAMAIITVKQFYSRKS